MTNHAFTRPASAWLLSSCLIPAAIFGAQAAPVLIGTYTSGTSKGIYACDFNPATGQLTEPKLAVETKNPAFLASHPKGGFVYAVSEISDPGGKKGGAVAAFSRDAATGQLTLLNEQPSGGAGPCHVSVDRTGKCVLVANYGSGSIAALPIGDDGKLGEAGSIIQHRGSSVNTSRQTGPHAHQIVTDPDNRFALVCDLGLDQVLVYRLDPAMAKLTPNDPPFATGAPGSGPRHLIFDPTGKFVFVLSEMAGTVTVFKWEADAGKLTEVEAVSALPGGFTGSNSAAELAMHPSGRYLFASNRGHDSVAVLMVNPASGRLKLVQNQPTLGKAPRFIGLDPSGKWLLAANQTTGNIVVFPFDPDIGKLGESVANLTAPVPVCLVFP